MSKEMKLVSLIAYPVATKTLAHVIKTIHETLFHKGKLGLTHPAGDVLCILVEPVSILVESGKVVP